MMMNNAYCSQCGSNLPANAKFCPNCGRQIGSAIQVSRNPIRIGVKESGILVLIAGLIFSFGWLTQGGLAGIKPTQEYTEHLGGTKKAQTDDDFGPEVNALIAKAKKSPDDKVAWQELASYLVERVRQTDNPPDALVLELIETLSQILRLDPKDPDALIAMADASFNKQVFAKAVEFYERYLALHPDDGNVRARYASALAFVNRSDQAISELNTVLAKDPKNFQANAYLAITYAQSGQSEKALNVANATLELAPNDEARARFQKFIDDFKAGKIKSTNQVEAKSNAPSPVLSTSAQAVSELIKANPIAGPKFARASDGDTGIVVLYFNDFPMQAMPDFAKQKFFAGLTEQTKSRAPEVVGLIFADAKSGQEMERLTLDSLKQES